MASPASRRKRRFRRQVVILLDHLFDKMRGRFDGCGTKYAPSAME
jgi:hypothetical protein